MWPWGFGGSGPLLWRKEENQVHFGHLKHHHLVWLQGRLVSRRGRHSRPRSSRPAPVLEALGGQKEN